mmetsp:Transcript_32877/g.50296  ORF Transcript_32877/g.50296 Transcript_32877/m.50296 type:complete len:464 (+) Transcript_32877:96-1487(+)
MTTSPPVEAAGRRLEKLLEGSNHGGKTVKRWLSTSSGASKDATLPDLSSAATALLDPEVFPGRKWLMDLSPPSDMDTTEGGDTNYLKKAGREVESWLLSVAVRLLWREKRYDEAFKLAQSSIDLMTAFLEETTSGLSVHPLLARMYRFESLVAESSPSLNTESLRPKLVHAHRLACLRRDVDTQATLLNLLLRDLLNGSQVEQAQKLLSNSTFPEAASNNQLCRYLYNSGRIQALRLEYTSAFGNLSQCLRKAPTNTGLGFRIAAQRLLVVVQLLMGEIPERSIFFTKGMVAELAPYLTITQAVRRGDLAVFGERVAEYATRFQEDGTYTLISRLQHSVVKAGLRKLHLSYSRISLQDIATRLGLPSATSAEFVVAKAVRDGVVDATIHHKEQYVQSHDLVDVYATTEPAEAFHLRIDYCLSTHTNAMKSMRYPPDAYKKQLEASRGKGEEVEIDEDDLESDY